MWQPEALMMHAGKGASVMSLYFYTPAAAMKVLAVAGVIYFPSCLLSAGQMDRLRKPEIGSHNGIALGSMSSYPGV